MDIICAKCGQHFNSIEAARDHNGHCKASKASEVIHWIPVKRGLENQWEPIKENEITQEQLDEINKLGESIRKKYADKQVSRESLKKLKNLAENYQGVGVSESKEKNESSNEVFTNQKETFSEENSPSPKSTADTNSNNDASFDSTDANEVTATPHSEKSNRFKYWKLNFQTLKYVFSLILIFACVVLGFGLSVFIGTFIPLWLLTVFSIIFSLETWLYRVVIKHVNIGRVYKLFLNLSFLAILGLAVWSGIQVFSRQYFLNQIIGSMIFITAVLFMGYVFTVLKRHRYRQPSMTLTVVVLICIAIVFSFAGVQPFSDYKDSVIEKIKASGTNITSIECAYFPPLIGKLQDVLTKDMVDFTSNLP